MMDVTSSFRPVWIGLTLAATEVIVAGLLSPPARVAAATARPPAVQVSNSAELQQAIYSAVPGSKILLNPGDYQGGIYAPNLEGTASLPIVIEAANSSQKPVIQGGVDGIYLTESSYVQIRDIVLDGGTTGLNVDDGGIYGTAHNIVLDGLVIRNTGYVGLKMAGVDNFKVTNLTVANWVAVGMDLVGCHQGEISRSTLSNSDTVGFGLVMKGGSDGIVVSGCTFDHAGLRAVEIGGDTGLEFFRPAYQGYEATNITVRLNSIVGSQAAVSFVSMTGAVVTDNIISRPTGWVFRILSEDENTGYIPCSNGVITNNIIAYDSTEIYSTVNVGIDTAPQTFVYSGNWWYHLDDPSASTMD